MKYTSIRFVLARGVADRLVATSTAAAAVATSSTVYPRVSSGGACSWKPTDGVSIRVPTPAVPITAPSCARSSSLRPSPS